MEFKHTRSILKLRVQLSFEYGEFQNGFIGRLFVYYFF